VGGKKHYFGTEQDAAMRRCKDEKDASFTREVRPTWDALRLKYLCDSLMIAKRSQVQTGELEMRP
jgi:hypothetical protein